MKRLLLIVLPLLLIVGCSKPVNEETLIEKDGLKYHLETKELFSGKVYSNHMGGNKKLEGSYKDGEKEGLSTRWYDNGQKEQEETYKDGKEDGLYTKWYESGQKRSEGTYKDGELDGLRTGWYESGQKRSERTFKDGKSIYIKLWNEGGYLLGMYDENDRLIE